MARSLVATHFPLEPEDLLSLVNQGLSDLVRYCRQHDNATSEEANAYSDLADRLSDFVDLDSTTQKGRRT